MLRLLLPLLLPLLALSSPALLHSSLGGAAAPHDGAAHSAASLSASIRSLLAPGGSALVFLLPPASYSKDGLTSLAASASLPLTRAKVEGEGKVLARVAGGVTADKLGRELAALGLEVALADAVPKGEPAPNSATVVSVPSLSASLDATIHAAMLSGSHQVVAVAAEQSGAERNAGAQQRRMEEGGEGAGYYGE
ncbi:hypothetical protein TeGR_g8749, partial [Tetraparma gracilis]